MYGNNNADKVFSIPVEWVVTENIEVKANSLEEAAKFILDHNEEIPCGEVTTYVDGTYKISADEYSDNDANTIAETLRLCWDVEERDATKYDVVDSKIGGAV